MAKIQKKKNIQICSLTMDLVKGRVLPSLLLLFFFSLCFGNKEGEAGGGNEGESWLRYAEGHGVNTSKFSLSFRVNVVVVGEFEEGVGGRVEKVLEESYGKHWVECADTGW